MLFATADGVTCSSICHAELVSASDYSLLNPETIRRGGRNDDF